MQVIDTFIEGDVVDVFIGQVAVIVCRVIGLDIVFYSVFFVGFVGRVFLVVDEVVLFVFIASFVFRVWVEGFVQRVVAVVVQVVILVYRYVVVIVEYEVGIVDVVFTVGRFIVFRYREVGVVYRVGVFVEFVVVVGRVLDVCGDKMGMSQVGVRVGDRGRYVARICLVNLYVLFENIL